MSDNNPLSQDGAGDRTIIKPRASRSSRPAASPPTVSARDWSSASLQVDANLVRGNSPLLQAGGPLISWGYAMRSSADMPDLESFRQTLGQAVRQFDGVCRSQGVSVEHLAAAKYVLCTFLDECANVTPWGGSGIWSRQSLLLEFHNETFGGEKVFFLLQKMLEDPPRNRSILELLYVILAFGFEGRYRLQSDGREQLSSIRERLVLTLRTDGPPANRELSSHWKPSSQAKDALKLGVPLWVWLALFGFALMVTYAIFRFSVNAMSDPLFARLSQFSAPTTPVAMVVKPAARPRLSVLLADAIKAGQLRVEDLADRSVVTLQGDRLFEAGSAALPEHSVALFRVIAIALAQIPGPVLVAGHSDSRAIQSLQFPSNWHLSQARAEAVARVLSQTLPGSRVRAEGRGDAEPVAPNSTAEGRARNRRVDITLLVQHGD
jgi:type VI secretion system protein ImpK